MNEPTTSCACDASGCEPYVCPLSRVVAGSAVRIKRLATTPDVAHRLREMGFGEEQNIRILSRHSNLICLVCNARLGISSQLADNIHVELLPSSPAKI